MCGLAGFLDFAAGTPPEAMERIALAMRDAVLHRGPDDAGVWVDPASGIAFGHRRLSIIDLSPLGRQPMVSGSGRFVLVFNGEIYNFLALRRELEGHGCEFRSHSDTETILWAVETWGVERALERFNGMFAIALWDRREHLLHFARDRFGEKPLYYGLAAQTLVFGSELKALRMHPAFDASIDRSSLAQFFRFGYVPAPRTIFTGIKKLPPGTWLSIRTKLDVARTPTAYFSMRRLVDSGIGNRFTGSEDEARDELGRLLSESVRMRMVSDVPIGAFLSGGIDSSTTVALMQEHSTKPVRTFTVGFAEDAFNEAKAAKAIATHLGTEHTEVYVTPSDAQAVIPRLSALYDEPFADCAALPTFLVAQLARQHVTVTLSGDAGDELFGGYTRYRWAERIWKTLGHVPPILRWAAGKAMAATRSVEWGPLAGAWAPPRAAHRLQDLDGKVQKLAELVVARDTNDLYTRLQSLWKEPALLVVGGAEPPSLLDVALRETPLDDFTERMMYADTITYLPEDILVKVDRASMGVGLEARVPMLDPDVVAFAWRLAPRVKYQGGTGKRVLRRLLERYVPRSLFEREKMGFGVPYGTWLRGPLRDWAESVLDEGRMRSDGYLRPEPIRARWRDHLRGSGNWEYPLWPALMFQSWLHAAEQRPLQARHLHAAADLSTNT